METRLISAAGMTAIAVLLLVIFAINDSAIQQTVAVGSVTEIRFVPAHWEGRAWQAAVWNVRVIVAGEDGVLTLRDRPPDWLTAREAVIVTFGHGRIDSDLIVRRLQPATGAVRSAPQPQAR